MLKRNEVASAWTFLDTLVENSAASAYHFTVMMKACETSTQHRELMEKMSHLNVRPDVVTYNMLVKQLMMEGDIEEAKNVVEVEMPDVGVMPNERTTEVLDRDNEIWSWMRTGRLNNLLKRNEVASSWKFFDTMVENSAANEHHFSVMMQTCETSTQRRELMEKMSRHTTCI